MDNIELEGGMPMVPPMAPQPQEDKGNPVTMNVSMNASGKDNVADLIDMMKNAGLNDAGEVSADMMPMRTDMERLRDIVKGPKDMDDLKPGMQDEPCDDCGKQHMGASSCMDDVEADDEAVSEYENEPEEEYKSIDDVIDSGDDLHRSKKAYPAAQDGDNAMAVEDDEDALEDSIREELYKAIQAKMAEGRGRGKKKKSEDIETTEGRGRGRGKKKSEGADHEHGADMEKCPECGKKKQKLMACGSCGCS